MDDDSTEKYPGKTDKNPASQSPCPVSRLSPPFDLVDLAHEISVADRMVASHASARLRVIADQIKGLQEKARAVLAEARENQNLHRARCGFSRRPGAIYHLYEGADGPYFSMLSPEEWAGNPPHPHLGSYRLEPDMSWTPADRIDHGDESAAIIRRLLEE